MRQPSPRQIGWALVLVLAVDLRAAAHLRRPERCATGGLPAPTSLQVVPRLLDASLRSGGQVHGVATVANRGRSPVTVGHLRAVLRQPAADAPTTWSETGSGRQLTLRPGDYGELPFVVHLARCERGPGLVPGFYELVVLVDVSGAGPQRSGAAAVVVSP